MIPAYAAGARSFGSSRPFFDSNRHPLRIRACLPSVKARPAPKGMSQKKVFRQSAAYSLKASLTKEDEGLKTNRTVFGNRKEE
jgi:hypothetical protein